MRTIAIRGAILVKIENIYVSKCIILGVFHRSKFWHLRRKPAVIFFKMAILCWCHEPHNQVKCRWKNKINFWTFIKQEIRFKFVFFSIGQTFLGYNNWKKNTSFVILALAYLIKDFTEEVCTAFLSTLSTVCS